MVSATERGSIPDSAHQTVHKKLVFFCRCLRSCVPHFTIAPLHEPPLQVDRVSNEWVFSDDVRGKIL